MPFFKRLFRFSFFLVILGTLFVASASAACVGVGTVNTSALRLRGEPSSDGEILATVNQGEAVVVLEQVDADWYKVDYRTVEGYMLAEFLDVAATSDKELGYGVVSVNDTYFLNVRSGPGTNYDQISSLRNRNVVSILGISDGWYKISSGDVTGYVSSDYIGLCNDTKGTRADGNDLLTSTPGDEIIAYAEQFIGRPYVWGGNGPNSFDCSGYTRYVFDHFGYYIDRRASHQATNGVAVSKDELQPGDLVFFHTFSSDVYITHVGIYAGGGRFLHASSSQGITYSDLNSSYYSNAYVCARRII